MADVKEPLDQLTYAAGPWIEETRAKLGQGHYGIVYAVKIRGLQCAGKKFDASLFEKTDDQENEGSTMGKRFVEQCLQLSQVRHPSVVQLLGVFFDRDSAPTLVTEVLPLNLAKCLEDYLHIPNYAKSSILLDVANGLRYVHEQRQPMVHGRLCAEKILLTISLQAKICGFVNPSGVILPDSSYTPPEATGGSLTVKGDVFSYGNLVLHVVTQNYPQPTSKEKQDPAGEVTVCSEFERREQSLKDLGENHALLGLVKQCLKDDPSNRPTTAELLREIEQHALSTPPPYASILQVMQEVEQVAMLKDNVAALTRTIEGKQGKLDAKQLEVDGLTQELEVKEKVVSACKEELAAYKVTLQTKDSRLQIHDQALRAKDSLIKAKAREIVAQNQELSAKDSQLAASKRRIATLEERLATGRVSSRFSTTPVRSPTRSPALTRSQQVSPTFKESPYKFPQSAEAEDLAARAGEVLRRSVPGRRGKTVPMSDGIFFHNAKLELPKSNIYGQQPVDPKLAAILAKRHQRYENIESEPPKSLEHSQQMSGTSDDVQLREQQRLRSGSANNGMSPEQQRIMDKRRTEMPPKVKQKPSTPRAQQLHEPSPPTVEQEGPSPPEKQQQKEPTPPAVQKQQEQQQEASPTESEEPLPTELQQQEPSSTKLQKQEPSPPEPQQQDTEMQQQQEASPTKLQQREPSPTELQKQEPSPHESQQQDTEVQQQPEPSPPELQQQEPSLTEGQQQEPIATEGQQEEPIATEGQQQEPLPTKQQQQEQDVPLPPEQQQEQVSTKVEQQDHEPSPPELQQEEPLVPESQQQQEPDATLVQMEA